MPQGWRVVDSTRIDRPGAVETPRSPYEDTTNRPGCSNGAPVANDFAPTRGAAAQGAAGRGPAAPTVVRLPAYEDVVRDPVLYAHASRVLHLESNPGNARPLVQRHGERDVWLNPPPIPLTTREMDRVYELPYTRRPHPAYGGARIPAYEMIRFSVTILRGCFGAARSARSPSTRAGSSRAAPSPRSCARSKPCGTRFRLHRGRLGPGGPTANMYRLACREPRIESSCRRLSCVYPTLCKNLGTDHGPLIRLYRKARALPGVKKVLIASGVRYDLAVESPEYVRELVTHHVGGYLKIAPEHVQPGPSPT